MYRKLIACLLLFFMCCSPAYASTTPSFLSMSRSVGSYGSVGIAGARYDGSSDTFYTTNFKYDLSGSVSSASSAYYLSQNNLNFDSQSPFLGFALDFSDMVSADKGDTWSVTLNHLMLFFQTKWNGSNLYLNLNPAFSAPVQALAVCNWSGTGKRNESFSSISGTARFPVNVSASDTQLQMQQGSTFTDRYVSNVNMQITFDLPDEWTTSDNYEYTVTSAHVDSMRIYVVYPFRPSNLFLNDGISVLDSFPLFDTNGLSIVNYSRFLYANGEPRITVFTSSASQSTNALQQSIGSVSQSISQLGQNITKQITEVKTTIQQGASEVKNEISNQTTTLTDKLTDVKDGIVQGVTELKETTEQGFEDVVQGITDLPDKIQEMLTEFIVPDEDAVADKMTDFQDLAEEKLGIIYQVPEMLFDAVNALVDGATNPQSTMSFPAFSLPWIDGSQLRVWDSQQFEIIPSGLENLRDLIQTVTSMVFVIMTFNSLKRAYERFFLGGGS